ncbi:unnamed protein product, partial [Staurois parvus]
MSTDRWHCWATQILSALRLSSRAVSVTAREERNADNRHFSIYMRSAVIG